MRFNKKWKKVLQPEKGKYEIYKKAGIVLLLSIVMFSAVYVTDNHRQLAQDENGNRILERKGQGEGKKTEKIQMETGEWKEKMKVQISEKKYAKEEIGEQLSKAAEELPAQILGENKSLDEVRSDLNLIMEIPHTGISVSWELDNYEVMNSRGVLKQEKLTEEGTLVKLTAVLRYDEEKMSCEFYAHLFSTPLSKKEGVLKKISQEVEKADQEQREKDYLILPDQVDGRKLSWKPVKEMRAFGILLLGGVMIVFQFTAEKQKQKEQRKKEIRQMQFDYPQLINKFSLYIGAGMTVRRAWIQIVKEYDKEKHYLGSYILNQLPPDMKMQKTKKIFEDLSKELNFNIALFLAYDMSAEYEILPLIQAVCKELLVEYQNFEYAQQKDLLKKLEYDIDRKVEQIFNIPKNVNIPKIQEETALKQYEVEMDEVNQQSEKDEEMLEKEAELDKMSLEFTKTIRIIEFLGDILKNYSSSIKRKPRIEIINLMYDSSMKLMGALYESLNGMIDTIIEIVDEKAKEDQEEIAAKSQFKMKINEFLSQFWGAFVGATVCNLGYSLQSDRIVDEIIDVRTEKNCTFFRMASIDYLIRTQNGHLPVKDIEECIKGKNKLDTFSRSILSQNVAVYLRNYQYDVNDKKAVCSLLNFNIKDIFIDEQKNKLISDV